MPLITDSLVPLLKIKFKPRCDDYTDQFNRILMVKLSLMACIVLSIHWLKDSLTCIVPEVGGIDGGYVTQACWIQGLYIYNNIDHVDEHELRYYGIPKQLKYNGLRRDNEFCHTTEDKGKGCQPLKKTFYLQYQWFPFYMGAIALLYYLPYVFFKFTNRDLITLKKKIKESKPDVRLICDNYFNYQINPQTRMFMRVLGNIFVKILYILANIVALVGTNKLLNGAFLSFGSDMHAWGALTNIAQFDYTATRTHFRAGDRLLPAYGICEVLELAQDVKNSLYNRHKFVCEISQNVLYQYTLMLLWFCLVFGLVVSIIGFIRALLELITSYSHGDQTKKLAKEVKVTLRECQYLEYVRRKKAEVYKELVDELRAQRKGRRGLAGMEMESNVYE